jgi:hypothetical protein
VGGGDAEEGLKRFRLKTVRDFKQCIGLRCQVEAMGPAHPLRGEGGVGLWPKEFPKLFHYLQLSFSASTGGGGFGLLFSIRNTSGQPNPAMNKKYTSVNALSILGFCTMVLTLSLTSCFSYSSTHRGPAPYTTTTVSQQSRSLSVTPTTTTTTRSTTY